MQPHTDKKLKQKSVFNTQTFGNNSGNSTGCDIKRIVNQLFEDDDEQKQSQNNPRKSIVQSGLQKVPFKYKNYNPVNVVQVKIVKAPETKIDISQLLSSISVPKHFNVGSILTANTLCPCSSPCPWGTKWIKWSRQPQSSTLYNSIKKSPISIGMLSQIQKDVKRTQPQNKGYRSFANKKLLQQILENYAKYDKQLQYIQGMNLITSVILYHVHKPQQTFWILIDIMERKQFRQIYINEFQNLETHRIAVDQLIGKVLPDLWNHFTKLQVDFKCISTGWLVSLLCNFVPLQYGHLVIDRFIKDGWKALYQIIVSYLKYEEKKLISKNDMSDLMSYFSPSMREETIDWNKILVDSVGLHKQN